MMEHGIFFLIFVGFVVSCFATAHYDRQRIVRFLAERNAQLVFKEYKPFGIDWIHSNEQRIYEIIYRCAAGKMHRAVIQTGFFVGVTFVG